MKKTLLSSKTEYFTSISALILLVFTLSSFQDIEAQVLPLSDQGNDGNWVLNTDVSDEFDNGSLDGVKWQIQGENGVYKSNFIGRAPSQFNPENAIVENNKLKILTKWEPSFPFSTTPQNGVAYENITTAAVISREQFHYGYMEIKSKAAKAEITSSFWTTGFQSELDMFEMFGDTDPGEANINWRKRLKFNMISWDPNNPYYLPDGNGPAHTRNIQVNDNTADDFHTYGFDWTPEYIKVYVDGVLHPNGSILRENFTEDQWTTNVPYWIWFDSETFPWLGIPEQSDLATPAEYEIEYIRVWEKKNLINTAFFGFEESIDINGTPSDWFIPGNSTSFMAIGTENSYRWANSLKFQHTGTLANNAVAFAPFGSINLDVDDFELSIKVWVEPGNSINNFEVILENPFQILNFDLSSVETGKWITVSQTFTRSVISDTNDRLRIRIQPSAAGSGNSTMYFDDIFINSTNTLSVDDINENEKNTKIYPNPVDSSIISNVNISAANAEKIVIYNLTGVKLHTFEKTSEPFQVPINNLKNGLYFISVITGDTTETKKLIIK